MLNVVFVFLILHRGATSEVFRKPFDVAANSGTHRLDNGCSFTWSATASGSVEQLLAPPPPPPNDAAGLSKSEALALLSASLRERDECVDAPPSTGQFAFRACTRGFVEQTIRDSSKTSWRLADFAKSEWSATDAGAVSLLVGGGQACEPNLPSLERSVLFSVRCGATFGVSGFIEVAMCRYSAVLTLPVACDPRIQPFVAAPVEPRAPEQGSMRWSEAAWLLESGDTADGRRYCSARNTGAGSLLHHVSAFEMSLVGADVDSDRCVVWAERIDKRRIPLPSGASASMDVGMPIDSVRISCALKG